MIKEMYNILEKNFDITLAKSILEKILDLETIDEDYIIFQDVYSKLYSYYYLNKLDVSFLIKIQPSFIEASTLQAKNQKISINNIDIYDKYVICIPTYNRVDNIVRLINNIYTQSTFVNVLVSDNGSSDSTYEEVLKLSKKYPNLKIIKNEYNIGIGFNVFSLIKNSNKKYSLFLSDEDTCFIANINNAILFMENNLLDYVKCYYQIRRKTKNKNCTQPGSLIGTFELSPKNTFIASGFISGSIFNTDFIKHYIPFCENEKYKRSCIYPHVILYYLCYIFGKTSSFSLLVSEETNFDGSHCYINPSHDISLKNSEHYSSKIGRVLNTYHFVTFIKDIYIPESNSIALTKRKELLNSFSKHYLKELFNVYSELFTDMKSKQGFSFISDLKNNINKYENKITDYENKITDYENKIIDYENKITDYENKITDYENNNLFTIIKSKLFNK